VLQGACFRLLKDKRTASKQTETATWFQQTKRFFKIIKFGLFVYLFVLLIQSTDFILLTPSPPKTTFEELFD